MDDLLISKSWLGGRILTPTLWYTTFCCVLALYSFMSSYQGNGMRKDLMYEEKLEVPGFFTLQKRRLGRNLTDVYTEAGKDDRARLFWVTGHGGSRHRNT